MIYRYHNRLQVLSDPLRTVAREQFLLFDPETGVGRGMGLEG